MPDCAYCEAELGDLDLDTEMCGECGALFEIDGDVLRFEGGETSHAEPV